MAKFLKLLVVVVLLLALIGCTASAASEESVERFSVIGDFLGPGGYVYVYEDRETGCQYMINYTGGICLVVNDDGTPYIGGELKNG